MYYSLSSSTIISKLSLSSELSPIKEYNMALPLSLASLSLLEVPVPILCAMPCQICWNWSAKCQSKMAYSTAYAMSPSYKSRHCTSWRQTLQFHSHALACKETTIWHCSSLTSITSFLYLKCLTQVCSHSPCKASNNQHRHDSQYKQPCIFIHITNLTHFKALRLLAHPNSDLQDLATAFGDNLSSV